MNWKPIETAPKDGKPIIVGYWDVSQDIKVVGFVGVTAYWHESYWRLIEGASSDGDPSISFKPTHWAEITSPLAGDPTDKDKWEGWNEPDSRKLLDYITPWMESGKQLTLSADQLMTVFLCLSRYHDLEDFGYSRDFEAIATYCPRTDDEE